jgi:hypothetical protein
VKTSTPRQKVPFSDKTPQLPQDAPTAPVKDALHACRGILKPDHHILPPEASKAAVAPASAENRQHSADSRKRRRLDL